MRRLGSGSPWEDVVGYSRVVRTGDLVFVSGTTGTRDGVLVDGGAAEQTRQALTNVLAALDRVGAGAADVVRTRLYVTDSAQWEAVGRVHGEFFGAHRPATAMVQVAALIDPAMVVEVEADAVVQP
ncbi:RidA family protein [Klenkia brasiliensis]|uniref:Enamine deaminase RidA, house cleaning of reactive enamine intermediates, YjgF/YER057c/UK114 family n=1 Tax=Klenkia brasiliensis TaxID=333142 RepID=A0A1G7VEX2_9ACTN|nr:RidA family protein [Klenkia brasiliensis]SDG58108.1 Enamine deaminase RidA, house cleaning of reactive enamine intermediates, YjgF/YER057c/UK114 family [Klenkia brasiliensis]